MSFASNPVSRLGRKLRRRTSGRTRIELLGGLPFYVHRQTDDLISNTIAADGVWEPIETELLLSLLRPGMGFVDVGANLGYYSVLASKIVGEQGRVIAFEPAPENFRLLLRNLAENRCANAEAHHAAAGERAEGTIELHLSAQNRGDHRVSQEGAAEARRATVSVPLTTVDRVVAGRPVALVKMDTQGAEAHILAGMSETLAANPELQIITEFWPYGLERAGSDPAQYLEALAAAGFALELILDEISGRPRERDRLREPIRAEQALEMTAGRRFEQHLNLLCRRSGVGA